VEGAIEGLERRTAQAGGQESNDAGVQASAEIGTDRHIASHLKPHRVLYQPLYLFDEVLLGVVPVDLETRLPVAYGSALAGGAIDHLVVSRQQLADSPKERALAEYVLERQIIVDRFGISLSLDLGVPEKSLDLRGEQQAVMANVVVQRLDAEVVTRREQAPVPPIVQQEGKHAVQSANALGAVLGVQPQDHLGIGGRPERVPLGAKLVPKLHVIVDLTIKHNGEAVDLHRLMAGSQVDDGETLVIKAQRSVQEGAFVIRAAMVHGVGHVSQQPEIDRCAVELEDADNAAHTDGRQP
jgi:hypothetical protein